MTNRRARKIHEQIGKSQWTTRKTKENSGKPRKMKGKPLQTKIQKKFPKRKKNNSPNNFLPIIYNPNITYALESIHGIFTYIWVSVWDFMGQLLVNICKYTIRGIFDGSDCLFCEAEELEQMEKCIGSLSRPASIKIVVGLEVHSQKWIQTYAKKNG